MRAMLLWEGVYRYGGMPIVREVIDPTDFSERPRNSFSDCVDSILVDCDRATQFLPDYYTDESKLGRATRIAALALKARVLLYAASPLFNTNRPYMAFPGHEDLIGYGTMIESVGRRQLMQLRQLLMQQFLQDIIRFIILVTQRKTMKMYGLFLIMRKSF